MPLYEYRCQECGLRFQRIEKASALKDGECPDCHGVAHRLIGAPALQFKGSGWYVTDYGKGNGDGSRENSAESETPKTTAESTPESKPEKTTAKDTDAKVA
jgi:putative FmdB family regulatory protein